MSNHTPGPWMVSRYSQCTVLKSITIRGGNDIIARISIPASVFDNRPYKANARLIAAAPDLLKAAKAIMDNLDGMVGEVTSGYHEDIIAPLRAAIAKATGEQP